MAGHMIYYNLEKIGLYDIYPVVHNTSLTKTSIKMDITDIEKVEEFVTRISPDFIINCIGVLVEKAKFYPSYAIYVNAFFPHKLKEFADNSGSKLIHLSTDCVFSGQKGIGYLDSDFCDADDIYGRSKALGEIKGERHLTIRTSIIGPELKQNGVGLFHWFMNQKGEVTGFTSALWGGVTTLELASYIIDKGLNEETQGLIQLTNGLSISKYSLLNLFQEVFKKEDVIIKPVDKNGVNKSLIASNKLEYSVPSYRKMIEELKEYMYNNKNRYSLYL